MRILSEGMRLAGRYTLTRRLGMGGMAEVWLASDSQAQSVVALKLLRDPSSAGPDGLALLKREWQIGSRLMHANIVRVFEFHDDPDGAFYSLQFIGETGMATLTGSGADAVLRPAGLLADALRYAHGKGVYHRDIKASNVLLDSRGHPYIVDFGVADAPYVAAIAGGGSAVASSPQQFAGAPGSAADDVYALGALMHELLTGQPPATTSNTDGPLATSDGSPLPDQVCELLGDMLAEDALRRPNAETVADRLVAAGYPPGPAPKRFSAGAATETAEPIVTIDASPAYRRKNVKPAVALEPAGESHGIAPRVLIGGLATALALFLAVIFVLPKVVEPEPLAVSPGEQESIDVAPVVQEDTVEDAASENDIQPVVNALTGDDATFSENVARPSAAGSKSATDEALGDLLSQLERLRYRAIDRWGGQEYLDALDVYAEGDQAYVGRNYGLAGERYRKASEMLEPFFNRIDREFAASLAAAKEAFNAGDHDESIRLFDLARSITPGNREAEAGYARATNLQAVLSLMEQGLTLEDNLELAAAKLAYEKALGLDALWQPAEVALNRVNAAIKQMSFEQRMTEGFEALASADFDTARAAFNAAKLLQPTSSQPTDGLLQLDQEIRLTDIRRLEGEAVAYDSAEQWESSVATYNDILKIDPDLQFAKSGLAEASSRAALHARLAALIDSPDTLSDPVTMQSATNLLLDLTRVQPIGPRLEDQKNELSRLLKRAATPLPVRLESDNLTSVSIFKIGRLGTFASHDLSLRPGHYVAVGIRPGFRDVRIEFHVAPEISMEPVVIQCEERI